MKQDKPHPQTAKNRLELSGLVHEKNLKLGKVDGSRRYEIINVYIVAYFRG
jgi:hypothetical protein